jgi:hypothetical protein
MAAPLLPATGPRGGLSCALVYLLNFFGHLWRFKGAFFYYQKPPSTP